MSATLAYQAPTSDHVAIGWVGDRLFLNYSAGLGQNAVEHGAFYADTLTPDSPTGRSRWTRQKAILNLPNIGSGVGLSVTFTAQGWPTDVIDPATDQPLVTVQADGTTIGTFRPTPEWANYTLAIPPNVHAGANMHLVLTTNATFTNTQRGPDPRPKGIRLAALHIQSDLDSVAWATNQKPPEQFQTMLTQVLPPAWYAVARMMLIIALLYIVLLRVLTSRPATFLITTLATMLVGIGLALTRIWMGALLDVALWLVLIALLIAWYQPILAFVRALIHRTIQGHGLNYGLIVATLAWVGYAIGSGTTNLSIYRSMTERFIKTMFPDSLLIGLLAISTLTLVLVSGHQGLPRLATRMTTGLKQPHIALVVALVCGGLWIGYETLVVAHLPYVGHADYADNAVVARNLVAGRGWVVDYVTQFYQLYDTTTRPQETWPLLQPVWIAPFLALFGPQAWAVKIPNLIGNGILLLLIYTLGTTLWDSRVGVLAAILTLTSHLFFKLTIYATSDLAFVLFTTAALFTLYRAVRTSAQPGGDHQSMSPTATNRRTDRLLITSGVLTGLMMLQKPSGAVIAVGMGIWLLTQRTHPFIWGWFRRPPSPHPLSHQEKGTSERGSPSPRVVDGAGEGGEKRSTSPHHILTTALVWSLPALLVLSPYLVRNIMLFQKPVYSTESYDAWVLGYRGDGGNAWDDIYRVYAPELDGPGIPDRSWILRWGFDLTWDKFITQVEAVRDYLLPAWTRRDTAAQPESTNFALLSQNERKNLFSALGAWLSLIGFLAALRRQRHLMSLLVLAFVPYTLFLTTYWHANEERYFLMLIPWLALLASWIIWSVYDRLAAIGDGRWSPAGLLLVGIAVVHIVQPSWPVIASKVQHEPDKWAPDLLAYEWLATNTAPDSVIMTRNPWQLNWHTARPAVMIPNTSDYALWYKLARHYSTDYIIFDSLQRVKGDAATMLNPLINPGPLEVGDTVNGFRLVYASPTADNRVLVYALP